MKRTALVLALAVAACSPPGQPGEIDEITQKQEVLNPFGNISQTIYVGRIYAGAGSLYNVAVFQRNDTLACWIEYLSAANSPIGSITVNVYGSDQNDLMVMGNDSTGPYCTTVNGNAYNNSFVVYQASESTSTDIALQGQSASTINTLECRDGGSSGSPGHNSTHSLVASNQYALGSSCNLWGSEGVDRFLVQSPVVSTVNVTAKGGNDCLYWNGNTAPHGTMGAGTDTVKASTTNVTGYELTGGTVNCGI